MTSHIKIVKAEFNYEIYVDNELRAKTAEIKNGLPHGTTTLYKNGIDVEVGKMKCGERVGKWHKINYAGGTKWVTDPPEFEKPNRKYEQEYPKESEYPSDDDSEESEYSNEW